MAELRGALIVCDRCKLSAFTKLGDYDSIETPCDWEKVSYGSCLQHYNLCPECYAEFEFAKRSFFCESATTQQGIIVGGKNDGK